MLRPTAEASSRRLKINAALDSSPTSQNDNSSLSVKTYHYQKVNWFGYGLLPEPDSLFSSLIHTSGEIT